MKDILLPQTKGQENYEGESCAAKMDARGKNNNTAGELEKQMWDPSERRDNAMCGQSRLHLNQIIPPTGARPGGEMRQENESPPAVQR